MQNKARLIKYTSVFLILIAVLIPATTASAALRICRTDPLVYFADGHKLSVTASVATDVNSIHEIVYTIHAPAGSQVEKFVHTAGGLGLKETIVTIDDQPAGVYSIDTIVFSQAEADVTSMVALLGVDYLSASGHTSEHLVVTIRDAARANGKSARP